MKIILCVLLSVLSFTAVGQEKEEPTLQINGNARISVKPDIGVLSLKVSEINTSMSKAIARVGDKTNEYVKILQKLKFKQDEIKTTSFAVSKNSIYRDDKYIDSGYVASQNIRIEFAYNQELLSKILNEFTKSASEVDFSFEFKLSEKQKAEVQSKIIELAVNDAKSKSLIIAKASGQKLKRIQSISYGWNHDSGMEQIEREQVYADLASAANEELPFNFTPDDLLFRDTVMITWLLE
ncbi:MAG: SIMPL domain-containing protein [Rufibacter sp.]